MAKPHPALIEIAAGRAPGRVEDDRALIESAFQHRMGGLAFHAADTGTLEVGGAAKRELAGAKLVAAAHNSKVERAAVSVLDEMQQAGWSAALFKGVATARRWYPDTGTRPTADVDLFLDPAAASAIERILDRLAPDHGLSGHAQQLFDAGRIQSVDFMWDDIWIDVHVDPIKVGVELPGATQLWERIEPMQLGDASILALDAEASVLQAIIHLLKDRFSRLHGFADIARISAAGVDWDWVQAFASDSGLRVHVNEALRVVSEVLSLDLPYDRSVRSLAWRAIWPERTRLRGKIGLTRKVRTHYWIPLTMPGRRLDGVKWLSRIVVPPPEIVDYMHPNTSGPYPWRVIQYRSRLARERHQRNKEQRREGAL